jgi:pyruvate,orthophosphate dikinase
VDERNKVARIGGQQIREGDFMSLNGTTGEIILGKQLLSPPELSGDLARFMSWVDAARTMRVFTNCDTPADAKEVCVCAVCGHQCYYVF